MAKKQWLIGLIVAGAVVLIFVIFNYQGGQDDTSLSEIFPEDMKVPETEYEFITDRPVRQPEPAPSAPAAPVAPSLRQTAPQAAVSAPVSTPAPVPASGSYSIQLLSSKDKAATERALEKAKAKGHSAYVTTKDLGDKGVWYRLNAGPYATKQAAEAALPSLKSDYKDSFIVYQK